MKTKMILDPGIHVLVASFGGVGTSFLSAEIQKYRQTNHVSDLDGYKHLPVPPLGGSPDARTVYVIGDPVTAVISLFRRGYHHGQSFKLQHCRLFRRTLSETLSLQEYAGGGRDVFHFQNHYEAWCEKFVLRPTLVLKYEAIHTHLEELRAFAGLPESFVKMFPEKRDRKSSLEDLDAECVAGLQKMYGKFQRRVIAMPDCQIVHPSERRRPRFPFAHPSYLTGLARDVFWSAASR